MTELCQHEQEQQQQQANLVESPVSTMPSFYPSTRQRTLISKHLTDHDDTPDSIYKEAFIIQIFQHWKIKTLEHQHAAPSPSDITTSLHFSQAYAKQSPSSGTTTTSNLPCDTSVNTSEGKRPPRDNDSHSTDDTPKPVEAIRKRVTPAPASYARRRANLAKSVSSPTEALNPNLLAAPTKPKPPAGSNPVSKKAPKPAPIFIAPKKTQSAPPPRPFAQSLFDESAHARRRIGLDKFHVTDDDPPTPPPALTWAPTPSSTRFATLTPSSPIDDDDNDDDETSSDESVHESLRIRNKKNLGHTSRSKRPFHLSAPTNLSIPTTVFVTDPNGQSRVFDLKADSMVDSTVDSSNLLDHSFPPPVGLTPSSSPVMMEKYALHSIGEEEEEGGASKDNTDGIILSKELDRIEAFTRSRQTNVDVQNHDDAKVDVDHDEEEKIPLSRRWSEGEDQLRSPQSALTKMASTNAITKQPVAQPTKISKTKYLLMKLHLASSASKDDDANASTTVSHLPPRKRTVRRSSDKKRYQTR